MTLDARNVGKEHFHQNLLSLALSQEVGMYSRLRRAGCRSRNELVIAPHMPL